MNPKILFIASDHAGFELKTKLQILLTNYTWKDLGPTSLASVDYPDFAERLALEIKSESDFGILICGSGIGVSIAANKLRGIRAAHVENPMAARLAREHNHANVLCLGSRFLAPEYAAEIIEAWAHAEPNQEERHTKRIAKIKDLELKN